MSELEILPEIVVPGKRLGRHVRHDPRSLQYPFTAPTVTLSNHRWSNETTPILDQGFLGSCTGNATVGALLCAPFVTTLSDQQLASLDEALAVRIYSRATETDPFEGTYEPDDTGSDGVDVAMAAREYGYISGFSHAFSVNDALAALTFSPVIIGINWYDGFDNPTDSGLIRIAGEARGGHEVCLDEIDASNSRVWFRNSWSRRWGLNGRAYMTFTTLGRLLSENGDATVFTPLTAPAPTPTPDASLDKVLAEATRAWSAARHVGTNKQAALDVIKWRTAKGL